MAKKCVSPNKIRGFLCTKTGQNPFFWPKKCTEVGQTVGRKCILTLILLGEMHFLLLAGFVQKFRWFSGSFCTKVPKMYFLVDGVQKSPNIGHELTKNFSKISVGRYRACADYVFFAVFLFFSFVPAEFVAGDDCIRQSSGIV